MEYVSPFDERRRVPEPLAPRREGLAGARVDEIAGRAGVAARGSI